MLVGKSIHTEVEITRGPATSCEATPDRISAPKDCRSAVEELKVEAAIRCRLLALGFA